MSSVVQQTMMDDTVDRLSESIMFRRNNLKLAVLDKKRPLPKGAALLNEKDIIIFQEYFPGFQPGNPRIFQQFLYLLSHRGNEGNEW